MPEQRPVIGSCTCPVCEMAGRGQVDNEVKLNKNGCGYFFCTFCRANVRFNKADTNQLFLKQETKENQQPVADYEDHEQGNRAPDTPAVELAAAPERERIGTAFDQL